MKIIEFKKGVSLLETLVVISITSFLAMAVMSILSSAVKIQGQTLYQQHLLDQATYALEMMTRDIKMAKRARPIGDDLSKLACEMNASSPEEVHIFKLSDDGKQITFLNQRNICVTYKLEGTTIKMIKTPSSSADVLIDLPIIASDIDVTNLYFNIFEEPGSLNKDGNCINSNIADFCLQPRITINMAITPQKKMLMDMNLSASAKTEPLFLQTTVSLRNINRIYSNAQ